MATYGLNLEGIGKIDATPVVRENLTDVAVIQNGAVSEMRAGPAQDVVEAKPVEAAPVINPAV